MGLAATAPADSQVEISVFGPGFGECIVIHIGSDEWIVIDSCISGPQRSPVALEYLRAIGCKPETCVRLILATHWHDDHIRGMAELVETCPEAVFCLSVALNRHEFIKTIIQYEDTNAIQAGTGVSEIARVLHHVKQSGRVARRAQHAKPLLSRTSAQLAHGCAAVLTALSPCDAQIEQALLDVGQLVPVERGTKKRVPVQSPNHLAVAAWLQIGEVAFLLGADLEETGHPALGWSAILKSDLTPPGKASFFKIPHHGSITGHHDEVWSLKLEKDTTAVLTPWNRGSKLPTNDDVRRISSLTSKAYATAGTKAPRMPALPKAVQRTIADFNIDLRALPSRVGHVRLRSPPDKFKDLWCLECSQEAMHLSRLATS